MGVTDFVFSLYVFGGWVGWEEAKIHDKVYSFIHMSPLFTFFFLYMWSLRDLLLRILIGRSHSLLHRIVNNTVRTQNSNLICQGWRGVYRNPWLAKMSETCLNQTLSKPKTCLSQTDFTVPSTKSLCNLNLCKPNYCLNWTNSSVPKGFGLYRFDCISQWTYTSDFFVI